MANFTNNYCRNPSFQMGLEGFTFLLDAKISLDKNNVLYGNQSCFVNCPGISAGEGCVTAGGIIPGHSAASASLFITGSGSVTIDAVVNPGGTVVGSTPVQCTNQWQRVQIPNITCTPGQTLFLVVHTTTALPCQFWISGIQIEDSQFCHPYCDGDQDGCEWIEGFWGGISVCFFQNPVHAVANVNEFSNLVPILVTGEKFFVTAESSNLTISDLVFTGAPGPVAAVTDFGISQLTDPDPAQTYTSWNTAGLVSSTGGAYTRNWAVFLPPNDYPVSNGQLLWKRAAYMSAGWYFTSLPNNGTVNLARVQTEVLPITTGYSQPAPSSFDPPRALHSIIKPNRLNYCTNPSIEVSTAGWTATGTGSVSQDSTVSVGQIIEYDDNLLTAGTKSLKVTVNSNGDGAQITIGDLITGYTYIASAYVQAGPGFSNILMSIANGETSVLSTGGTGYGFGGYGSGPYGGIDPTSDLATSTWFRINCIFTATSDSHALIIQSSSAADISYPSYIWVDAVMVEQGEVLSFYFDGSFGVNYNWESGGTAGLARSYFYDQQAVKTNAVLNILQRHTPLGILADTPLYRTPPIQ